MEREKEKGEKNNKSRRCRWADGGNALCVLARLIQSANLGGPSPNREASPRLALRARICPYTRNRDGDRLRALPPPSGCSLGFCSLSVIGEKLGWRIHYRPITFFAGGLGGGYFHVPKPFERASTPLANQSPERCVRAIFENSLFFFFLPLSLPVYPEGRFPPPLFPSALLLKLYLGLSRLAIAKLPRERGRKGIMEDGAPFRLMGTDLRGAW